MVGKEPPGLTVGRALDLIAVIGVIHLPGHLAAGDLPGFAQVDLPGLSRAGVRRAPARFGIAIHGMLGRMSCLRGRCPGRLAPGQVDRHTDRLRFCEGLQVFGVQLVHRPQQSPGHQVQVPGIAHRLIIVAQSGAEDAGLPVGVGPGNHHVLQFVAHLLAASGEWLGRLKEPHVVVELLIHGGPVVQSPQHRVLAIDVDHVDRLLRTVPRRVDTHKLKPIVPTSAVAVHRTVQIDRRDSLAMGRENVFDIRNLGHIGRAFVVDDHVVPIGPIG